MGEDEGAWIPGQLYGPPSKRAQDEAREEAAEHEAGLATGGVLKESELPGPRGPMVSSHGYEVRAKAAAKAREQLKRERESREGRELLIGGREERASMRVAREDLDLISGRRAALSGDATPSAIKQIAERRLADQFFSMAQWALEQYRAVGSPKGLVDTLETSQVMMHYAGAVVMLIGEMQAADSVRNTNSR